jgi:hypothetical protein
MGSSGRPFSVRGVPRPHAISTNCSLIGHFYLTKLLLPTLIASAEDSLPGAVRVVTTSSIAHNIGIPPSGMHWDTLGPNADVGRRKEVGTMKLYSQSKLVSSSSLSVRADVKHARGRGLPTGEYPHHERACTPRQRQEHRCDFIASRKHLFEPSRVELGHRQAHSSGLLFL